MDLTINNIEIKLYTHSLKNEWNDFLKLIKNPVFFFQRDFMEYHCDRFCDHSLMFYKKDNLIAILPANISENILYSHAGLTFGGLLMHQKITTAEVLKIFEVLITYCKSSNIKEIFYKRIPHIYSKIPAEEDSYALYKFGFKPYKAEVSSVINLQMPISYSKNRERLLGKAKKEGVETKESTDFKSYFKIVENTLKTRHNAKPVHSYLEMQNLAEKFPNNIKLIASFKDNKMIAGTILFLNKNKVCHTQYLSANESARGCGGLDASINHAILHATENGFEYFSLGISTEENGKILNEGLIAQKEQFGARAIVHESFKIIL
jgi:hypothetical protein